MANGDWWFKFEYKDWVTDPALGMCSLATQGFWLRVLCAMTEKGSAEVSGTALQFARMVGCTEEESAAAIAELTDTGAADVTQCREKVTLVSRRLSRDLKLKEQNKIRKRRERGHADVTPASCDRVRVRVKEENNLDSLSTEKARAEEPEPDGRVGEFFDELRAVYGVNQLRDERRWLAAVGAAIANGFSSAEFCAELRRLLADPTRKFRVTPENVLDAVEQARASDRLKVAAPPARRPMSEQEKLYYGPIIARARGCSVEEVVWPT